MSQTITITSQHINDQFGGLARTAEISAVEKAAGTGFEGVEVTFGGVGEDGLAASCR